MKKLTTEEKAKAYDKAIERANSLLSDNQLGDAWIYKLLPELKDSEDEDERIRKVLRERIIRYDPNNEILIKEEDISQKQFLDWIERQGEHKKFRDGIQVGDKVTRNREGMLVNLSQLNRVAKKDEKQGEQKPTEWNPQPGDTFRKKGTISPTYHLCNKREDGITFGFVENNEVGISGGEITIFALRNDYELVERLKPIEKVVEEEFNKVIYPNNAWSEEDEKTIDEAVECLENYVEYVQGGFSKQHVLDLASRVESLKDRVGCEANCTTTNEWSEEDENHVKSILSTIECCKAQFPNAQSVAEAYNADIEWFISLKDRYTWKPNEEQMKALDYAVFDTQSYSYHKKLSSLKQQLKKLREE